jgi:Flp pilus assembly protein TadG
MSALRAASSDDRGGTYVELLIVILPVLTVALGILQLTQLYSGKLAVDHAAVNAARAATTVFADDPKFYGGERVNSAGPQRAAAVRTAAARALAPFALDGSIRSVDVTFPGGIPAELGAPFAVQVTASYRCGVPLAYRIVCGASGKIDLIGSATLASNAADYEY